jgi:DNA-binding NarL/FixJ family response regulator
VTHRIYIVEDYDWLREMLVEYVGKLADMEVCGSSASGEAALEELAAAQPDLVMIDLSLPGMHGTELIRRVRSEFPSMLCLVLSAGGTIEALFGALAAGAAGYVEKGDPNEIALALEAVTRGTTYISESSDRRFDAKS